MHAEAVGLCALVEFTNTGKPCLPNLANSGYQIWQTRVCQIWQTLNLSSTFRNFGREEADLMARYIATRGIGRG